MQIELPAWYSARTKPKHEHIAAANLQRHLGLEVFSPRLRLEKLTKRGLVRVIEPLFPCYIFVRCVIEERIAAVQHTTGISRMVRFGDKIPQIPNGIIAELQGCFAVDDTIVVASHLTPGDEVTVAAGAFVGMSAFVLKNLPAKKRVQILLDVLGRPTPVEVGRETLLTSRDTLAELAPTLAATAVQEIRL